MPLWFGFFWLSVNLLYLLLLSTEIVQIITSGYTVYHRLQMEPGVAVHICKSVSQHPGVWDKRLPSSRPAVDIYCVWASLITSVYFTGGGEGATLRVLWTHGAWAAFGEHSQHPIVYCQTVEGWSNGSQGSILTSRVWEPDFGLPEPT